MDCAIYRRQPMDAYSLEEQEERCRGEAVRQGMNVVKVYTDEGTASNDGTRSGMRALLADLMEGQCDFETVLMTDVKCLSENGDAAAKAIHDLWTHGVTVSTIDREIH